MITVPEGGTYKYARLHLIPYMSYKQATCCRIEISAHTRAIHDMKGDTKHVATHPGQDLKQ